MEEEWDTFDFECVGRKRPIGQPSGRVTRPLQVTVAVSLWVVVKAQRSRWGRSKEERERGQKPERQHSQEKQKRMLTYCSERAVPWEPERRESEDGGDSRGVSAVEKAGEG